MLSCMVPAPRFGLWGWRGGCDLFYTWRKLSLEKLCYLVIVPQLTNATSYTRSYGHTRSLPYSNLQSGDMENMETKVKTPKVQKISKNVVNWNVNSMDFLMFL